MVPVSSVFVSLIVHLLITGLALAGVRLFYYYEIEDFTVNPRWKSEHFDN